MPNTLRACVAAILFAAAGCPKAKDASQPAALPFAGQSLTLAVVADDGLADAAERLAAEWKARTGAAFDVQRWSAEKLRSAKALDVDAIVFPAGDLGMLAERGWLQPVPQSVLEGDLLAWKDVFPLARGPAVTWGETVCAVPFGLPLLTCYYRADLLDKAGKQPPETWAEYQELAAYFNDRRSLGDVAPLPDAPWSGTAEPLALGWCGLTLLARAAAYVSHPYYESLLFDAVTMKPRIDQAPYVRALDELLAASRSGPAGKPLTPEEVRHAFWQGRCALALAWPSSSDAPTKGDVKRPGGTKIRGGFIAVPGAREVFNWGENAWEDRHRKQLVRVPLLDVAGMLGAVSKQSSHAEAAFQMLASLSGPEFGQQVTSASAATTFVRPVPRKSLTVWMEREADAEAAKQYSVVLQESLGGEEHLCGPRIPGRADYLAALDAAVERVLAGNASSGDSLRQCAEDWRQITERHGVGNQRKAYERSLGHAP